MAGVQARGIDMVIDMYENRQASFWAIVQGKQFMFRGEDSDDLRQILTRISRTAKTEFYTLKVYDTITDIAQLKDKTPCDGSFNFCLADDPLGTNPNEHKYTISSITKKIEDKIANKLGIVLDEMDNEAEEEPQTIGEIISRPDKLKEYIEAFGMIASIFKGQTMVPAMVGTPERVQEAGNKKQYTQSDQDRLIAAINTLETNDPDILAHLEKLASISEANKPFFEKIISMLNVL